MTPTVTLRTMQDADRAEVADLIYVSMNYWYAQHGGPPLFRGGPSATMVFSDVYETLDPGSCLVAESDAGRLMGSCYYRERETHCALGIMNVHPVYWGLGVGKALLDHIAELSRTRGKPLRLVSSAMNLDSFSLYTRAGFVPSTTYQDLILTVPEEGLPPTAGSARVRPATAGDLAAIGELELEISGIGRASDYAYFVENREGFWHASVYEGDRGLEGWLVSCGHPGLNMIGPGVARTEEQASALLRAELNVHAGRTPLFLLPVTAAECVRLAYSWGARNCEMHVAQSLGPAQPVRGVTMPTFMPETG